MSLFMGYRLSRKLPNFWMKIAGKNHDPGLENYAILWNDNSPASAGLLILFQGSGLEIFFSSGSARHRRDFCRQNCGVYLHAVWQH